MRVNPKFANLQYMYANGDVSSALPEGTYSKLAAAKYVKDNDKNKDKSLSIDEVSLSQAAFDKLDADKNGKISQTEMKDGLAGKDAAIQAYYNGKTSSTGSQDLASILLSSSTDTTESTYTTQAAASFIDSKDKDSDDSLSLSESGLSSTIFNKRDLDQDGKLEASEIQSAIKSKEKSYGTYYTNNVSSRTINSLTSGLLKTI